MPDPEQKTSVFSTVSEGRWVLISMIMASSMAFIDGSALNIALPAIQKGLQATGSQLLWVVNSYALILAALILVGGALGDLFGRRKIMLWGISIFTISSFICALSPTILTLIFARGLQGIGAAMMIPGSLSILSATFQGQERGKAIGIWSTAGSVMAIAGPVLGGLFAASGLWRCIFLINLPIGIAACWIIRSRVPESRNMDDLTRRKIDYSGSMLISLGLGLLTYGFTEWAHEAFTSVVKVYVLGGIFFLIAFIVNEARVYSPMMPLTSFRSATFTGANLLTFFLYGALASAIFFVSLNLVQIQGYSTFRTGFAFLAFPVPIILFSRQAGRLASKYGAKWLLVIGPAITGLGFLRLSLVGLTTGPSAYWATFFPGMILFGLGMSLTVVPLTNSVMTALPDELSGTASGINNAVSRIASVLALAIIGSVAIIVFQQRIIGNTHNLLLPEQVKMELKTESHKLAAARPPDDTPASLKVAVSVALKTAFTDTFSLVMQICAGMAFLSACTALLLIK